MVLYLKTTKDKYEFPLIVADTVKECADRTGASYAGLRSVFSRIRSGNNPPKTGWKMVCIDDSDEEEDL